MPLLQQSRDSHLSNSFLHSFSLKNNKWSHKFIAICINIFMMTIFLWFYPFILKQRIYWCGYFHHTYLIVWYVQTRAQNTTKLKKIIQDSKDLVESVIRSRMQPLKDQLIQTINSLHKVFEVHVFVATCRGLWDRMGQVMLHGIFLTCSWFAYCMLT